MLAVSLFVGGLLLTGVIQCPFAFLFHVPCPGCGLTRASLRLLHGDLCGAFAFHPMVFVAIPVLAAFFGLNSLMYLRTGEWGWVDRKTGRGLTRVALAIIVLMLVLWISRFFGAFGGPVAVLPMDEILSIVIIDALSSLITYLVLRFDRARLDAYGKDRMWNDATFRMVVGGPLVGIPPTFGVGAHVWVTRRGPWWLRLLKALFAALATTLVMYGLAIVILMLCGLPLDD